MVVIRLARGGQKKRPFYRIVVADKRCPRDGRYIEQVGTYNPNTATKDLNLKLDRVDYWHGQGAKPSDTVARLINHARSAAPKAEAAS